MVQTQKISSRFRSSFLAKNMELCDQFRTMVEWGTISKKDLDLFLFTDDVDEAVNYLVESLLNAEKE